MLLKQCSNWVSLIFRCVRSDDGDQLQLHFNAENDEPALDLFIVYCQAIQGTQAWHCRAAQART